MLRPAWPTMPPGSVTGVGSLPFSDGDEAVAFVAEHSPTLPFWPQLPRRCASEGIIAQSLGPLIRFLQPAARPYCWKVRPGAESAFAAALEDDEACLIPETAAGFFALERAVRADRFPHAVALKAQTEGPVTAAHCLYRDGTPLIRLPGWLDRLADYLARQVAWQVRRLRAAAGRPVIVALDEPALALTVEAPVAVPEMQAAISRVLEGARQEWAVAGLHCCTPLPIRLLAELDLDLLSFDAHLPVSSAGFIGVARGIMQRGGCLAFGLVPTGPSALWMPAALLTARWLVLASMLGDCATLAGRSLVTATCGLGLSTPAEAAASFDVAREIGASVRGYGSQGRRPAVPIRRA